MKRAEKRDSKEIAQLLKAHGAEERCGRRFVSILWRVRSAHGSKHQDRNRVPAPKTGTIMSTSDNSSYISRSESQVQNRSPAQGVKIQGFGTKSSAKEAGMQKGDVIVESDGVRNLTTETLLGLTTTPKPDEVQVRAVIMRHGREYSLSIPPGSLGIAAMDTMMRGSSRVRTEAQQVSNLNCNS